METSYSLSLIQKLFPEYESHTVIDLYCQRQNINNERGVQKTAKEIYGHDPALHLHYALVTNFIRKLRPKGQQPPVIIVWGWFAKDFFRRSFTASNTLDINGEEVSKDPKTDLSTLTIPVDNMEILPSAIPERKGNKS